MAFSATEAAFEGFRVVRRHPLMLIFWVLFYLVVMAATFAVVGGGLIALTSTFESLQASGATSPEDMVPLLTRLTGVFAVVLPVSLLAGAVINAAVARAVLRPADSAFGYLRLGRDEVRVLVVSIALFGVFFGLMTAVSVAAEVVARFATSMNLPALGLGVVVLVLAGIALFVWLSVRLSLAIPITLAERRIAIFDSFAMTRGRFWPLLGMALLAGVMTLVVGMLGALIATPIQMATGGLQALAEFEGESLPVILQAAWPAIVAWIVVNAAMSALQVAVVYAPFSAAYRDIKGGQALGVGLD